MPTRSALLHIYRDTPMGREHLMQSAYFCKKQFGLVLSVFIPEAIQFTLQLESEIFPVQLDASYVASDPEQARKRVEEIVQPFACPLDFVIADPVGSSGIPHLPGEWGIMTCPRVISEQSSRIGLGRIGPKVRALVKAAPFPVFIPSLAYKPWNSVTAFYGGSPLGALAVKEAMCIARLARIPLQILTQLEGTTREACEKNLEAAGVLTPIRNGEAQWRVYEEGTLEDHLFDVPYDSLVVIGAAGNRLIEELVFGSTLELVQSTLPNPLVVVGPHCRTPLDALPA